MKTKIISILILGFLFTGCSTTTVEEKLAFETENLTFKIIQKNSIQDSVKFFKGYALNSRTGSFESKSSVAAPAKGKLFVSFKFSIMNKNADTVKIHSESDYKIQTSDGENIPIFFEMTEQSYASAPFVSVLLPKQLKENEFLLALPKNQTQGVKFLFKGVEGAVMNF